MEGKKSNNVEMSCFDIFRTKCFAGNFEFFGFYSDMEWSQNLKFQNSPQYEISVFHTALVPVDMNLDMNLLLSQVAHQGLGR